MKHLLAIILLFLAIPILAQDQSQKQVSTKDQRPEERRAIIAELYATTQAYKAGKFLEAQRHAERALQLQPTSKLALQFIARSIHAQYRPGDQSPENIAKAREAISAYERILLSEPENEEAFKAVAALYGAIGEDERQYSWILQRALSGAVPASKRAEAYVILASKDWNCSYSITESPDNKLVKTTSKGEDVIAYRAPKDKSEFEKAQRCTARGLEMAETAISLEPENDAAWSFKTNLLLEAAKLAEMDDNTTRSDEYEQLANDAQTRTTELSDRQEQKPEEVEPDREAVISNEARVGVGSVLAGKVINAPRPAYPAIAKRAKAHGRVVVEVIVDEEGRVTSANASSGHPLLRAAAVQAAKEAVFSPTILSGQPVKVAGEISYYFRLE